MNPEALARETDKYRRMWGVDDYKRSPGLRVVPMAFEWFQDLGCVSATDWGCGDGQAMEWLGSRAVDIYGVDLVDVADAHLQVFAGPISDPGDVPATDFSFSADVLEHLPPDDVDASLESIRDHTTMGGFFQIATRPDSCGERIGETLHLTVRPGEWWEETVGGYFEVDSVRHRASKVQLWLRV